MKLMLLGMLLLSQLTFAGFEGNGSTGGGHVYGDKLNPWFLQNTVAVNYCVEITTEFSELSREQVLESVEKAIGYWKRVLTEDGIHRNDIFGKLGTQDFVIQDKCDQNTDLAFQMGFLTQEQIQIYPDYKQTIGLASRTSYDQTNLKGKGFIYIAAEKGQFRPISPNMVEKPWSSNKYRTLELTLTHELGHVFGLQDDHYFYTEIMGAFFVSNITDRDYFENPYFTKFPSTPSPFGCNEGLESSEKSMVLMPTENELTEWLKLPKEAYSIEIKTEKRITKILINDQLFGTMEIKKPFFMNAGRPLISLYLTSAQKVFSKALANVHHPFYLTRDGLTIKENVMELADGRRLEMDVVFDQQCSAKIGAVHNGRYYYHAFFGL